MMRSAPSAPRRRPLHGVRVVRLGLVLFGLAGCAESAITDDVPATDILPSLGNEAGSDDGAGAAPDAGGPAGGEDTSPPWTSLDAGAAQPDLDAGRSDAGARDAGSSDAGVRDAGAAAEAGTADADAAAEAGTTDAGVRDAGSPPADAGTATPDAGTRDAGTAVDAGGGSGGSCNTAEDCNNDCSVAGPIRCCSANRCGCSWFTLAYCSI
jgi:hypothetical protein